MSAWLSEGIVHCNNLENNFFFFPEEEVVSMNAGNKFCNGSLIFYFKNCFVCNKRKYIEFKMDIVAVTIL